MSGSNGGSQPPAEQLTQIAGKLGNAANQMAGAFNQMATAAEAAGGAVEKTSQRVVMSEREWQRLRHSLDPNIKALDQLAVVQEKLARATAAGRGDEAERVRLYDLAREKLLGMTAAAQAALTPMEKLAQMRERIEKSGTNVGSNDLQAYTRALNDARAAYDPIFAANLRLKNEMAELARAATELKLTPDVVAFRKQQVQDEYTKSVSRIQVKTPAQLAQEKQDEARANLIPGERENQQLNTRLAQLLEAEKQGWITSTEAVEEKTRAIARYNEVIAKLRPPTAEDLKRQTRLELLPEEAINQRFQQQTQKIDAAAGRGDITKEEAEAARRDAQNRLDRELARAKGTTAPQAETPDQIRARLVPEIGLLQQKNKLLHEIAEAERVGHLTAQQAARARALAEADYQRRRQIIDPEQNPNLKPGVFGLPAYQVSNLQYQVGDVVTQLATGTPITQIALQQGPQILQIFDQMGDKVDKVRAFFASFTGQVVLTGAALLTFTAITEKYDRQLNELSVRLRSSRTDFDTLSRSVSRVSRDVGTSSTLGIGEARETAQVIASSRGFQGTEAELNRLTRSAADVARMMGTTAPEAAKLMAEALRNPGRVARQLAESDLRTLDDATLRSVESLIRLGRQGEASALVLGSMDRAAAGAAQQLTPLQRAFEDLGNASARAYDRGIRPLIEAIGRPVAIGAGGLLDVLTQIINKSNELREFVEKNGGLFGRIVAGDPTAAGAEVGGAIRGAIGLDPNRRLSPGDITRETNREEIMEWVRREAQRNSVDPDFATRIVTQESGGRQYNSAGRLLVNPQSGAMGLGQLMPGTARDMGVNPADGAQNIIGTVRYLNWLREYFNQLGEEIGETGLGNDQSIVAAGYNAGPRRVRDFLVARGRGEQANLPQETWNYVNRVSPDLRGEDGRVVRSGGALAGEAYQNAELDRRTREANVHRDRVQANREELEFIRERIREGTASEAQMQRAADLQRELLAQSESLVRPEERRSRNLREQLAAIELQEGAVRRLRQAEIEEVQQARTEGRAPNLERVRTDTQLTLNAELDSQIRTIEEQTRTLSDQAQAWNQNAQAQRDAEIAARALQESLRYGVQGSPEQVAAVERLTAAYRGLREQQDMIAIGGQLIKQRNDIEQSQLQRADLGLGVTARDRALNMADLQARQHLRTQQIPEDSQAGRTYRSAMQNAANERLATEQLASAYKELEQIGTSAFDRIAESAQQGFRNIGDVGLSILKDLGKQMWTMSITNPIMNALFGSNRPTADTLLTRGQNSLTGNRGNVIETLFGSGSGGSSSGKEGEGFFSGIGNFFSRLFGGGSNSVNGTTTAGGNRATGADGIIGTIGSATGLSHGDCCCGGGGLGGSGGGRGILGGILGEVRPKGDHEVSAVKGLLEGATGEGSEGGGLLSGLGDLFKGLTDSLGGIFSGLTEGLGSLFGGLFNGIGSLFGSGGLGGLFGGAGGAGAATGVGGIGGLIVNAVSSIGLFHEGGVAGSPRRFRQAPAQLFLEAPRYHSGYGNLDLRPNEIPAILERDELVLTRPQQRNLVGALTAPMVMPQAPMPQMPANFSRPSTNITMNLHGVKDHDSFKRHEKQVKARLSRDLHAVSVRDN